MNTTVTEQSFNKAADMTYGSICCLCFFIGTVGNLISFIYFKSKRRDISNVIYMFITGNDILVSIVILPVGISSLSNRKPGPWFENEYGCAAWVYLWYIAVSISIFLVMCLSITRTVSLLRPFKRLKIRYLIISIIAFTVLTFVMTIIIHLFEFAKIDYSFYYLRCEFFFTNSKIGSGTGTFILLNIRILTYVVPVFVVATSCVISAVVLKGTDVQVQQQEVQRSRNQATVTILLFAALYGVCNIPVAINYILMSLWIAKGINWDYRLYGFDFDTELYYNNASQIILLAANSAANPALYYWRMPALREGTLSSIRRKLGLIREFTRPANNVHQVGEESENNVVQNVVDISNPAAIGETRL